MLAQRLLTLLALSSVVAFAACGGDDGTSDGPESPTPVRTAAQTTVPATSTASPCPVNPAACTLASALQRALASADIQAVLALHEQRSYECPGGRPQGPGGPFPLCDGRPAGERNTGVQMARRYSEGFIVAPPDYIRVVGQFLQAADTAASDAFGPGAFRLYSVSCLDPNAPPATCPRFAVVFSAILRQATIPPLGTGPGREVLAFFAATSSGQTRIESTWTGIIMANEAPVILQQGGTLFDLGRLFPYRLP
ncbi:MAG TPA: hypothetical protein VNN10_15080 [Dehalococcoidia bacterium]|nr:hypothetical protein [Dehalococcoidia bacterium]